MFLLKALRLGRISRIAMIRLPYCSIKRRKVIGAEGGKFRNVFRVPFESAIGPTLVAA